MSIKDRQIRNQLALEKEFWRELGSLMRARILLIERHGNRGLGFLEQRMADKIVGMYDWFKANRNELYLFDRGSVKKVFGKECK